MQFLKIFYENIRIYEVYAFDKYGENMNIVIISGRIISEVDFNFIYNKNKKEKHTSIAICKLKLDNESIIDVYGYDEVADYLYRNINNKYVYVEGIIDTNMMVEIIYVNIFSK